jgi:hypothetical protein
MPARGKAISLVECFAKRSLAYREGNAKAGNVERFVDFREREGLCLLDEFPACLAVMRGGGFRLVCDRSVIGHRSTCTRENNVKTSRRNHTTILVQAILSLGATGGFFARAAAKQALDVRGFLSRVLGVGCGRQRQ